MTPEIEKKIQEEVTRRVSDAMSQYTNFFGDKYLFERNIQILDGRKITVGQTNGLTIGTAATQKIALWGATPVDQPETVSDASVSSVSGTGDDANINSSLGSLATAVNAIIDRMQEVGSIK